MFNPYLEAGFGKNTFKSREGEIKVASHNNKKYVARFGVESNCMSCHGMASIEAENKPKKIGKCHPASISKSGKTEVKPEDAPIFGNPGYTANFYYSLDEPCFFNGQLKLDFAWSIANNAK